MHYCSQQRGYPGMPLENYTTEHIRREFVTEKSCAPCCTSLAALHKTSCHGFLARPAAQSRHWNRFRWRPYQIDPLGSESGD